MDEDIDLKDEYLVWGKHEFCAFKCGADCDQVMELHPRVAVITDYGTIIEDVPAHWDDGDRSVGIPGGYYIDENVYGLDNMYIIWPRYAEDDWIPINLLGKVNKFREEKVANGLYM